MSYPAKFELGFGGKMAKTCWGCGLFASCEELKYLDEKTLWLCGNCQEFCKTYAPFLVKNEVSHLKLRTFLKEFRHRKK